MDMRKRKHEKKKKDAKKKTLWTCICQGNFMLFQEN